MGILPYSFHYKREFAYIVVFLYGHLFIRSCREHMNERADLTNLIYTNIITFKSKYIFTYSVLILTYIHFVTRINLYYIFCTPENSYSVRFLPCTFYPCKLEKYHDLMSKKLASGCAILV